MNTKTHRLVLEIWRLRALRASVAHYRSARNAFRADRLFTLSNVAVSIIVLCLSIVNSFLENDIISICIGLASVVIVISSILQFILDHRTLGYNHARAATGYGAANRRIEQVSGGNVDEGLLVEIRAELDNLGETAPIIPKKIWDEDSKTENSAKIKTKEQELSQLEPDL